MNALILNVFRVTTLGLACAALLGLTLMSKNTFAQNPTPQETPPAPAAPRSIAFQKTVERTLKNGLRVIVIEDHDTALVSTQLMIKNGAEVDPPALSGLADMTASLLTKGTQTRTAPEIAQAIEALGGTLDAGAYWDASRASISVMSSKIEPAMMILADVVRRPVFTAEEVERLRQQNLDALTVSLRDPGTLARYVATRVVFGDAAYGHSLDGTPETLARVNRDDIVALHSKYYRPDNAILVIGGDITADNAFKLAESKFGDWAKPATALPSFGGGTQNKNKGVAVRRVVVVDMPDAGQAAVILARTGITRTDTDYYRGLVTNAILSGYSGRLNQEIRIKRGLSYGARSTLDVRREVGPYTASAQTKNPSGAEVASLLTGELARLSSEPVLQIELTPRQAVVSGNFSRGLETTNGLVTQLGALALYGLDLNEINLYIKNVQAVTPAEVQAFAGAHLGAKESSIIIVGNAKDFIEPLRKQFPEVEVIPVAELDLNSASLRKPRALLPL